MTEYQYDDLKTATIENFSRLIRRAKRVYVYAEFTGATRHERFWFPADKKHVLLRLRSTGVTNVNYKEGSAPELIGFTIYLY